MSGINHRGIIALGVMVGALVAMPFASSQAALIQDLKIDNGFDFTGEGQVEFTVEAGTQLAQIVDFNFNINNGALVFDLGDVLGDPLGWTINSNWLFDDLSLVANIPTQDPDVFFRLTLLVSGSDQIAILNNPSPVAQIATFTNTPQHSPVPVPAALFLLGPAVAGLGGAGWLRRRKASAVRAQAC